MILLTAALALSALALVAHLLFSTRRPGHSPRPSPYWLDAIEGARNPSKRHA